MEEIKRKKNLLSIFPKELVNSIKGTPMELALNHSIDLETRIEFLLPFLGVPTNLNGYKYIKYAILLIDNDETKIKKVTSRLYPEIAEICNTTPKRVERSIRHSIEICFNRMNVNLAKWFFGYSIDPTKKKCTNIEFISRIMGLLTNI